MLRHHAGRIHAVAIAVVAIALRFHHRHHGDVSVEVAALWSLRK
jgi:hypothetical protein